MTASVIIVCHLTCTGDGVRATICLGGSILVPEQPDVDTVRTAASVLRDLRKKGYELLVVAGGGKVARVYIDTARKFKATDVDCDTLGIDVTRLNARLLISALGDIAEQNPVTTFEAAVRVMLRGKIPVMGGTVPGHTTDAVAAGLADASRSDLLIFFTNVDGIYTADPKLDPRAKKIETMTSRQLLEMVAGVEMKPGITTIVDPISAKIIDRSRIKTLVLGKNEISHLQKILEGAEHSGTTVVPREKRGRGS